MISQKEIDTIHKASQEIVLTKKAAVCYKQTMTCFGRRRGEIFFSVVCVCNFAFLISLHHCILPKSSEQRSNSELLVQGGMASQSTGIAVKASVLKEKKHCASIHAIFPRLGDRPGLETESASCLQLASQLTAGIFLKDAATLPGKDSGPPSVKNEPKNLFYISTFPSHAPPVLSA